MHSEGGSTWLSDAVDSITHKFILAGQRGEPRKAKMLDAPPPHLSGGVSQYFDRYTWRDVGLCVLWSLAHQLRLLAVPIKHVHVR